MRDEYVEVLVKRILPEVPKLKTMVQIFALLSLGAGILFSIPIFYIVTLLILLIYHFKIMRMNCEYEYYYLDGVFDIAVIYNKSKRKNVMSFTDSEIEFVAPVNSQETQRYDSAKIVDCSAKDELDEQYIVVVRCNNEWKKVVIQMNDELLKAFKKQIPMKVRV